MKRLEKELDITVRQEIGGALRAKIREDNRGRWTVDDAHGMRIEVPMEGFGLPLVMGSTIGQARAVAGEARKAMAAAGAALDLAEAQIACVEAREFFEAHPKMRRVEFFKEVEPWGQKTTAPVLRCRFLHADNDYDGYDNVLSRYLGQVLRKWAVELDGVLVDIETPRMAMAAIGEQIMGSRELGAWMASAESFELGQSAPSAAGGVVGSSRL